MRLPDAEQHKPTQSPLRRSLLVSVVVALSGCASYQSSPLPITAQLPSSLDDLTVDASRMPTKSMRSYRFDATDGLDLTEVAMLAVLRSPELEVARAQAGVMQAQAFAAGLLPDPQVSFSTDHVMGLTTGSTNAYAIGISEDIGALISHFSNREALASERKKINLDLLWQEWQTIAKVQLIYVKLVHLKQINQLLTQEKCSLEQRTDHLYQAARQRLMGTDIYRSQFIALRDVQQRVVDTSLQINQYQHDLNTFLRVDPSVSLSLTDLPHPPTIAQSQVDLALSQSSSLRPDLLALQEGYKSEDARYRSAIRSQFPALTLGPHRARDTSDQNTIGWSFGLTLPLFNRNQGSIAIEQATREKLRIEYLQRLETTHSIVHRLITDDRILRQQRNELDSAIAELSKSADQAQVAFKAKEINALGLGSAESVLIAKQIQRIAANQAIWEQVIALQALIGVDLLSKEPLSAKQS